MPVQPLVTRALAAAIVVQLSVAGVVLASGGAGAEAAAPLERAEILDSARVVSREPPAVTAAQVGDPVEVAAPTAPPPPPPVAEAEPVPAPVAAAPVVTSPPATTPGPRVAAAAPPSTAPSTTAPAPAPPPPTPTTASRDVACDDAMLRWMVDARRHAGVQALVDDPAIDHVAIRWSDRMASAGRLDHNPGYSDEVFTARPEARTAGEVVGRGLEPRAIFDEFMRSPTHRDAILRQAFTHATVGCVRDAGGQAWVTANFWG
jgi:uncharacterized protein YkwD